MNTAARSLIVMAALLAGTVVVTSIGCAQKETILDVETPGGEVEVKQDKTDGEIEVDVDDN